MAGAAGTKGGAREEREEEGRNDDQRGERGNCVGRKERGKRCSKMYERGENGEGEMGYETNSRKTGGYKSLKPLFKIWMLRKRTMYRSDII